MKNLLESLAIILVGFLSLAIVYLIIQYNMIEDEDVLNDILSEVAVPEQVSEKSKAESYLQNLEGYDDIDEELDVDVDVDVTKENLTNAVTVVSEQANDDLDAVVEDKSKSAYMKNLEDYTEKEAETKTEEAEPTDNTSGEPQKLEHEEIVDKVGMAIDAALEDI